MQTTNTQPFSVEESLDRFVESVETPPEPDGLWHPSSISSLCDRKSLYEIRGTPKEPLTARTKRIFRVGHLLHEFVQSAIAADPSVIAFWSEVPIDAPDLRITGHADGLIEFDDSYEVLEFKTIKSTAFKYGDLPKPDHISQVSLYMKVLREYGTVLPNGTRIDPLGDKLRRARIIYVSKDDLLIGEYPIFWTDARNREIEDKLVVLETHLEEGTLPDRLPTGPKGRHYLCGYCPFQSLCWE